MNFAQIGFLLLTAFVAVFAMTSSGLAADDLDEDPALRRHFGFRYLGGYDANTVRTLAAEVRRMDVPDHGPVLIDILSEGRLYHIVAGPYWLWSDSSLHPKVGELIWVKGSLVQGRDASLYILATEIWKSGAAGERVPFVRLRDADGRPLWMKDGKKCRDPMGRCMEK